MNKNQKRIKEAKHDHNDKGEPFTVMVPRRNYSGINRGEQKPHIDSMRLRKL